MYQSVSGLRSCGLWLEHHQRKVLVTAVLVGAQRCANLLAAELVVDVEILLGRRAVQRTSFFRWLGVFLNSTARLSRRGFLNIVFS